MKSDVIREVAAICSDRFGILGVEGRLFTSKFDTRILSIFIEPILDSVLSVINSLSAIRLAFVVFCYFFHFGRKRVRHKAFHLVVEECSFNFAHLAASNAKSTHPSFTVSVSGVFTKYHYFSFTILYLDFECLVLDIN